MSFIWPEVLLAIAVVPIVAIWLFSSKNRQGRKATAYADPHLLPKVIHEPSRSRSRLPLIIQLLALGFFIFAASRPVASPSLPQNKAAVILTIDTSRSMLADDAKPSRLERAKTIAQAFLQQAPKTTQIGLVVFSDNANIRIPPTTDRSTVLEALTAIETAQATSLANAIAVSVRALPGRKNAPLPNELQGPAPRKGTPGESVPNNPVPNNPVPNEPTPAPNPHTLDPTTLPPGAIVLLSDGVSNRGVDPKIAAEFANRQQVKLYTVPIGKEGGTVTQVEGKLVFAPFDGAGLKKLSELTGGRSVDPDNTKALQEVFSELGTTIRWEATKTEVGYLASALGVILLVLGGGISLLRLRRLP